jgi:hypothetical protein
MKKDVEEIKVTCEKSDVINTNTNNENAVASENCDEKAIALANHLGIEPDEVTPERHGCYGMSVYSADGGEYAVGTDDESDKALDQSLDSYVDDCGLLDSMPDHLVQYFDREAWKNDARNDGRGQWLSSYDGDEIELGNGLYAFRIN